MTDQNLGFWQQNFRFWLGEGTHGEETNGIHLGGTAGGYRDHWHSGSVTDACGPGGSGSGAAEPLRQQSQADWAGMHNYESVLGVFPPAYIGDPNVDGTAYGIAFGDANRNGPSGFAWGC